MSITFYVESYECLYKRQYPEYEPCHRLHGRLRLLLCTETDFKTNIIIIDKKIVWYGGINPYTNFQFGSDIMRIEDKAVADDLLKDICK